MNREVFVRNTVATLLLFGGIGGGLYAHEQDGTARYNDNHRDAEYVSASMEENIEQQRLQADNLEMRLEDYLASEESTSPWNEDTEWLARESFNREEFDGSRISEIECRSTICRMAFESETMQLQDRLLDEGFSVKPFNTSGFIRKKEGPDGEIVTLVYFTRNGIELSEVVRSIERGQIE